ncbi:D-alpha,beta-D-heptose 1,7-bisphosphate phosphatase [Nitrosospira sp. Nsp18]|uniref:D-glycero-alpha-D-manno-heptose-1,7-bisphosphate 7-phosphatase n=1 Tax=Nitrosospira sp. Nsp18 TaxID=1855334 RepID=UPI000880F87D|nr:HAD family hydrolase [Nitrosospira sp. Nsp18]SDA21935.1 D-alpha,beta-D-heptose 1,7-bisphosphate phosphatase [Nitrosospira sp. Nsp18]
MSRPALFLDRDGVINIDFAYVYKPEQFEFIEGVFELCQWASQCGYLIFVITNQAGIGRGYYTEQDFLKLTDWMCGIFKTQGSIITKVYFCPSHPEYGIGEYKVDSFFRKPGPGMILQAAEEFCVDLARSVLVGDKEKDIQAGIAAGVGCNLLYHPDVNARIETSATIAISDLSAAQNYLAKID